MKIPHLFCHIAFSLPHVKSAVEATPLAGELLNVNALEMTVTPTSASFAFTASQKVCSGSKLLEISVVWCPRGCGNLPDTAFRSAKM